MNRSDGHNNSLARSSGGDDKTGILTKFLSILCQPEYLVFSSRIRYIATHQHRPAHVDSSPALTGKFGDLDFDSSQIRLMFQAMNGILISRRHHAEKPFNHTSDSQDHYVRAHRF
jgi:hypothetical protein